MRYLKAASTGSHFSFRKATKVYEEMHIISQNTKNVKKSPEKTVPIMPLIISRSRE